MLYSKDKHHIVPFVLVIILLSFMIVIFGPTEIFFANFNEFPFVFKDFIIDLFLIFILFTTVFGFILPIFIPVKIKSFITSVLFGLALAGYIQIMFFNKHLDLLGVNPLGYAPTTKKIIYSLILWVTAIILLISLKLKKELMSQRIITYGSIFLFLIQFIALISLLVSSPSESFQRPVGNTRLSAEQQFTVSSKQNIVVFILDYYSSQYHDNMLAIYPDGADCLHDFTRYTNADPTYYGTFPSLAHMLTGCEIEPSKSNAEWFQSIWTNSTTESFYHELKEKDFKVNLYTTDSDVVCRGVGCDILENKIDNLTNETENQQIDKKKLTNVLIKMSMFRFSPDCIKNIFYTQVSEYQNVVSNREIIQVNDEFYSVLKNDKLKKSSDSNYFIIQHLIGTHETVTDEFCNLTEHATIEETARGCMRILEEYINQMKELGVYDRSTIIVTADHGGNDKGEAQVIYYQKAPYETHEISPVTNAPVCHCDFMPTIAQFAGISDYNKYGLSSTELEENQQRERSIYIRKYDENYPKIGNHENVYYKYTYTGDILSQITAMDYEPTEIIEITDPYF